jgi:hypothetical protein
MLDDRYLYSHLMDFLLKHEPAQFARGSLCCIDIQEPFH